MTNVIKRIDYEAFSTKIERVVCFCAKCDPNGEGGHGGYLCDDNGYASTNKEIKENYQEFTRFCPTCGDRIDWDNITEKENHYRN